MRIGITTFGADGGRSGIGRYTASVIQTMTSLDRASHFDLYAFRDEQSAFATPSTRMETLSFRSWLRQPVINIAWHQAALRRWCRRRRHDVLFLPAANRRLPLSSPCPTVGTFHDFSSLHVTGKYDRARLFYIKQVLPMLVRRLTHVLTVSESSKRDIVEYAGVPEERVTVTPLAVDHDRYDVDRQAARERLEQLPEFDRPFLLYVSRIEHPGKNHVRLIEAFNRLKEREKIPHRLVLAGSDWLGADQVHQAAAASQYAEDIHFTGFVPEDRLLDLYCCADMLVFPSQYEGFGLPVLEAMSMGLPVACADTSSLPEVAGEAAAYFEPHDVESLSAAIWRLLADQDFRQRCVSLGRSRSREFTWEKTARKTLDVLSSVA